MPGTLFSFYTRAARQRRAEQCYALKKVDEPKARALFATKVALRGDQLTFTGTSDEARTLSGALGHPLQALS